MSPARTRALLTLMQTCDSSRDALSERPDRLPWSCGISRSQPQMVNGRVDQSYEQALRQCHSSFGADASPPRGHADGQAERLAVCRQRTRTTVSTCGHHLWYIADCTANSVVIVRNVVEQYKNYEAEFFATRAPTAYPPDCSSSTRYEGSARCATGCDAADAE